MDFKQIQELIKLVNDSNIGEVTIEQKEFRLTIKQKEEQITQMVAGQIQAPFYPQAMAPQQLSAPTTSASTAEKPKQESATPSNTITIKSPMIGTFYRSPSPKAGPYVEVGTEVTPDTVVCIIEAMKVMNEIKAEAKGVITQVLVDNAKPVEFGQPLFKLRPA